MRVLINFLLALVFTGTAVAESHATRISSDQLTEKVWKTEVNQNATTYYDFQESMALDIITQKANGNVLWSTAFWNLSQSADGTFLSIKQNLAGEELLFRVNLDGQKLILSNDKLQTILAGLSESDNYTAIIKQDLIGKWKSPFYDLKSEQLASSDTKVRHMWKQGFTFNEDGTFTRHQQVGRNADMESGVWSLSKDGNFIKLHYKIQE